MHHSHIQKNTNIEKKIDKAQSIPTFWSFPPDMFNEKAPDLLKLGAGARHSIWYFL